jgi:N-acylneuraminate cytidylyltransferase
MKPVAIIPARGGSKRLPRKNALPILGRPILSYPIRTALESGLFEQVIVSTEDHEIARIGEVEGARIMERPEDLATDISTVVDVCLHVLDSLERENSLPAHFCCIYATAFLIQPEDLCRSYGLLKEEPACDFVMGVSEYSLHPVQALIEKDNFLTYMWPEYQGLKSQKYPRLLCSNGTLYWADTTVFKSTKSFYAERLRGYLIPQSRAVDIDTQEDYEIAQIFASHFRISQEK